MNSTSIRVAIEGVDKDPPDLEGYLGLTDSIVPIILNASSETELESNEDDNDPKSDEEESTNNPDRANESELESDEDMGDNAGNNDLNYDEVGDNDPKSDKESVNNPDTVRANNYNDYSLEKAKKILWRLKQRDLLDLIDEVDSTETEKVLPLIIIL